MGRGGRSGFARALAAGVAWFMVSAASVAHADGDDANRSAARTLATDGLKAWQEGRFADALDLFQRAEGLVHAPPHLLYIARASAKQGKLVEANEAYMKILREPVAAKAPKAFVEAQKAAAEEQAALAPRLPKLTVVVKGEHAGQATVTMDGAALPRAVLGVAQPADPGAHVVQATAPGWTSDSVKVELAEGASETVTVELNHPNASAAPPTGNDAPAPAPPAAQSRTVPPVAWVALGVGVVGLGAGTFFLIQNRGKRSDANALCNDQGCPESKRSEIESLDADANSASTLSWIGYGVGAAGVVAGAALIFLGGASDAKTTGSRVRPWVGAGSAGVVGSF